MDKGAIFSIIKKHIMTLLPNVCDSDIQPGVKMSDLGANSIDRAEVVVTVMAELNIKIPLLTLGKAKNLNDLTDIIFQVINTHEKS